MLQGANEQSELHRTDIRFMQQLRW